MLGDRDLQRISCEGSPVHGAEFTYQTLLPNTTDRSYYTPSLHQCIDLKKKRKEEEGS